MSPTRAEEIEERVRADLRRRSASFREVRIDPAHADTATFCARYGFPAETSANCIVVASRGAERRHAACLVRATQQLDVNRVVRRLLGVRKASFAPPEEAERVSGHLTDGVTPFGLPEDLSVYVDGGVLGLAEVVVGGGSRALKIAVDPEVFARDERFTMVEDLTRPPPT